ncbi:alpha/beta hydrolase [Stagnimonas aquatica]|uniref:Alpha/beta hydrolase n=1 Tax=Stagnimonas aquatica TaxID=2689987 RepID=A0A3N0VGY0_9GAMM|nr:alpha/beta hydrolase [Stagnimonas aquatica]ROH91965.1 alpha/beta hydrolase [Stagnimonas aquatica]
MSANPTLRPPSPEAWRAAGAHFDYRGQRIYYRDSGASAKPALLLIHGFPSASWDWHGLWAPLAERFRLIAPDMIGFGFSTKPRGWGYSIHDQADLHAALCARLGVSEVHVLAHDYGVSVAQELLARHEAAFLPPPFTGEGRGGGVLRLRSIVFLNGGLFPETHRPRPIQKLLLSPLGPLVSRLFNERGFRKSFSAVFGPDTKPSAAELAAFWQLVAYNDGGRIMHELIRYILDRRQHRERWLSAMQRTAVPMRLINGPVDPVSGAHMVARYRELIAAPDVVSLPGIGHYPQVEAPQAVLDAFLQFHDRQRVS